MSGKNFTLIKAYPSKQNVRVQPINAKNNTILKESSKSPANLRGKDCQFSAPNFVKLSRFQCFINYRISSSCFCTMFLSSVWKSLHFRDSLVPIAANDAWTTCNCPQR
nr:odorant receptor 1 [Psyttalia incisi]